MNYKYMAGLLLLASMAVLVGCQEDVMTPHLSTGIPTGANPQIGAQPDPDAMAATVNGVKITSGEVDRELGNMLMQYRNRIPPDQIESMIPMFKQKALESLVNMNLLKGAVIKEQISVEESSIEEKFAEVAGRFPDQEQFEKQLAMAGLTKEKLRSDIDQNLKIEKLLEEKLVVESEVSDEDISEYFEQNKETFKRPEEVKASHILISKSPDDSEEAKKEKQDKLSELRKQIIDGADFAELATAHSDCPSKSKGGDLGFFTREKMVPPFSDAAFSLEKGEMSGIVETDFGYHLIKTTDKHEAGVVPLEEVKEDIKGYLTMQNEQDAFKKYINELSAVSDIEYGEGYESVPDTTEE